MDQSLYINDNHAIIAAQHHALAKKLPMAVVYCFEPVAKGVGLNKTLLNKLKKVESDLNTLQIPFMVLIGDSKVTLAAVQHHTKPDFMYYESTDKSRRQELIAHPYKWPGVVKSISSLQEYMSESDNKLQ